MANAYLSYDAVLSKELMLFDYLCITTTSVCSSAVAKIALALGYTADALAYLAISDSTNAALGLTFFNRDGQFWDTGSQSAQALALSFDLGNRDLQNMTGAVAAHLVDDVLAHGTHLTTGTLGARWLLQALSGSGRSDVALSLAAQTTVPSWGYMVSRRTLECRSYFYVNDLFRFLLNSHSVHCGKDGATRRARAAAP